MESALGAELKELLGLWPAENEGAKYSLGILTELKNRGVADILIAEVDGLTGFGDAIRPVFPQTECQLYLVHVVRSSLRLVPYKDRRMVAADLKKSYTAQRPVLELSGRNPPGHLYDERGGSGSNTGVRHWTT